MTTSIRGENDIMIQPLLVQQCLRAAHVLVQFLWMVQFIQLKQGKMCPTVEQILQQKEGDCRQLTVKPHKPTDLSWGLKLKSLLVTAHLKLYLQ